MNINGFLTHFGNKSFETFPFTEVDALLLAELSYVNLETQAPLFGEEKPAFFLKDLDLAKAHELNKGAVDAGFNQVMMQRMKKCVRYKDIEVRDCEAHFSQKSANQFAAYTFILPNKVAYLSFRGTDYSLAGWKEDFYISYEKETLSQAQAKTYANKVIPTLGDMPFYLGGHSKGGNHAFYAALNLDPRYTSRLLKVYSFDGPGFKQGIDGFPSYPEVQAKLRKYLTQNDVVGMFYNNNELMHIVRSDYPVLGGHDPFYWLVNPKTGKFYHYQKRSFSSIVTMETFKVWLATLSDEDLKLAVDAIFEVFGDSENVYQLMFKGLPSFAMRKKKLKKYTPEEQAKLNQLIPSFYATFRLVYARERQARREKNEAKKAPAPLNPSDLPVQ